MKVIEQHYHRNGSAGDGFVVSLIEDEDEGRTMLSISFMDEHDHDDMFLSIEKTATIDIHKACEGNIKFGPLGNSHRAEYFGPIVAEAWSKKVVTERAEDVRVEPERLRDDR